MAKILISILSDNPIANFLFYKEKQDMFDSQIFITTPEMKEKEIGKNMENAMCLALDSVKRIEVLNDNFSDIIEKLKKENFNKGDEYWINQTGGTKAMSIAAFQFFQAYNAHFVYLAIGGKKFVSLLDNNEYPVTYFATLREYLALYGIRYESTSSISHGEQQLFDLFNKVKKNNWYLPKNLLRADSYYEKPQDKVFYKGGWFEEYSYMRIKKDLGLSDDQISVSAKLYRKDSVVNDNEIDVMFVKDNVLNIVECKVGMNGYGDPKNTVIEYLYKLAAIAKDLGLRVNSYIFTLHKMDMFSDGEIAGFSNRVKILGIKGIWDGYELSNTTLNLNSSKTLIREKIAQVDALKSAEYKQNVKEKTNSKECEEKSINRDEPKKEYIHTECPKIELKIVGKIDLSEMAKK